MAGFTARENAPSDASDIMRQMGNADPKDVEKLIEAVKKSKISNEEVEKVDLSKLKVKKDSIWVMQLCPDGFASPDGKFSETYQDGYKPLFSIVVCESHNTWYFDSR